MSATNSGPQLTNPSAIKQRSMGMMIVLFIITLGFYGLYWLYAVNKELAAATDDNYNPVVRTLLAFVIIGAWQTCQTAEAVVDQDGAILFLLWLVFSPAAWYLVSSGMNQAARPA